MKAAIRSLVPLASVLDVERSIRFYARLGFEVRNTFTPEGADAPGWVSLESRGAALMLARAEMPLAPNPPVLFYLYCQDVESARQEIREAGVEVGPITRPF
jgi:predicted enzyme related to lactoylglutathione lyase